MIIEVSDILFAGGIWIVTIVCMAIVHIKFIERYRQERIKNFRVKDILDHEYTIEDTDEGMISCLRNSDARRSCYRSGYYQAVADLRYYILSEDKPFPEVIEKYKRQLKG